MKLIKSQRPALTTWPGFGRLADLRNELDDLFESPFADFPRTTQLLDDWIPALDFYEEKDNFIVKAELPGVKKEDVKVTLQDGCLSISGERKSETKGESTEARHIERFHGKFQRTIILPAAVAADKVKAQYKDGILTITLPKTEEAKPKQIDVSVN
jgi:HSP20 family protein